MRPLFPLPVLIALSALPAAAGQTPWQEVEPGVLIRLISSGVVTAEGTSLVALEFDMPETTKTYWRIPGQGGLAAVLDFSRSSGIAEQAALWPYPELEAKADVLSYVYYGDTVLPIEVSVTDPQGRLDLSATLGVCSSICIPAQLDFSLPLLDATPDASNGLRIRQAMAEVPISWDGQAEPLGRVVYETGAHAIGVFVNPDLVDPATLIAATASGYPLFGAPQKSPQSDLVLLPILGKTDNIALDGMAVELTFMTDRGAYVVNRTIAAPDADEAGRHGT